MNQWILDTDSVSLLLLGNRKVIERAKQHQPNVSITVVTVQELYNGWVGRINRNSDPQKLVSLYGDFARTIAFVKRVRVLGFDKQAMQRYIELKKNSALNKRRIEKDVRIAAIALSNESTLVTRNTKDFALVPDLTIESWV